MELNHKDVANGSMNGRTVFICDYNRPDKNKKPLRSVPPTEVQVVCNSETNKKVYYSESHFRPVKNNGELGAKVIALFDNTGFRSHPGNPLHVFDNMEECEAKWNEFVNNEIDALVRYKAGINESIDSQISSLKESLK